MKYKNIIIIIRRIFLFIRRRDLFVKTNIVVEYNIFGSEYGGWPVVAQLLNCDSVIYSAGVGEDISFDLALINKFNVTIHAFDPTPSSIKYVNKNLNTKNFIMHPYGLYNKNCVVKFYQPENKNHISHSIYDKGGGISINVKMRKIKTVMEELGHNHIDLLKIDIEGAEYDFIKNMLKNKIYPTQLLIEFHHRFKKIKPKMTKEIIYLLNKCGYKLYFVSKWGTDYGFIIKNHKE